eukprot:4248238-Pleurochrysis_carterae.AAC.1
MGTSVNLDEAIDAPSHEEQGGARARVGAWALNMHGTFPFPIAAVVVRSALGVASQSRDMPCAQKCWDSGVFRLASAPGSRWAAQERADPILDAQRERRVSLQGPQNDRHVESRGGDVDM